MTYAFLMTAASVAIGVFAGTLAAWSVEEWRTNRRYRSNVTQWVKGQKIHPKDK